jgi:hypothetical protein
MMNRNERMEKLQENGVNVSKYFNVELPNGLKPGATIYLIINENGQPVIAGGNAQDSLREQIIADGYVRNTKLHRRFVMAQMFHMLNYVSYDGKESGYNACLRNRFDYKYTLDMMTEEVRVLGKLEKRDHESFMERSHFFTKAVVIDILGDYLEKLKKYVDSLPNKNCKGVPYKKVKGANIFNTDLDKKLYRPIRERINRISKANSYDQMYKELAAFMKYDFVKLPYNTAESKAWIDAYKGEGAYYTLKNLVMFHDCGIRTSTGHMSYGTAAEPVLKYKLDEYMDEGWRMFALMKKVIEDNNFDFNKRMAELGK